MAESGKKYGPVTDDRTSATAADPKLLVSAITSLGATVGAAAGLAFGTGVAAASGAAVGNIIAGPVGAVIGAAVGGGLIGMDVARRTSSTPQVRTLNEEHDPLMAEIAEIVLYPDAWLNTPNDQLGGQPPRAFLGSADGREILHNLIQMVKHGMAT